MDASGKLIDYNTADSTATGVALVAGEHKFMIAKSDATNDGSNYNLRWIDNTSDLSLINYSKVDDTNDAGYLPKSDGTFGGSTHLSDDFTIWTAGALSDFNGKDNTEVIAAASKREKDMYGALNTFNTSDSHNDWYVPACGQLALMYLNMIEINAALTKIGGTALAAADYWSSTEHSLSRAWRVYFSNGNVDYYNKVNNYRARFVRNISISKPLKERVSELEELNAILVDADGEADDPENIGGITIQSDWNETDSTSGAYIKNKPTIPSAVTESTVSGWGFTKNTGTYSKPSAGIPKSDLASAVQTSLGKADTALQSVPSDYAKIKDIPTKVSQLENDSDFVKKEDVDNPDEEDITSVDNKLKFKDRTSDDGMGYVILRKDKTLAEQMTRTNTIYEIRYDFDLDGKEVTIPSGCTLKFEGGKFLNGTININGNQVESVGRCFDNTIKIKGINLIKSEWFGISTDSSDISGNFNTLVEHLSELNQDSISIEFKESIYRTKNELRIGVNADGSKYMNSIGIVGYPTFFMDNNDATCLNIVGSLRSRFEFSIKRDAPALWGNNNCVGVVFENCKYCDIHIHNIMYFTYGIITRADGSFIDGGLAWNEIYIDEIYSALQGFVIESINNGWPNANNVHGGIGFNVNTGTYVTTNATVPSRAIVLKTDGKYGANGWSFNGLWLENHENIIINGKGYVGIDLCDYVNGQGMNGCVFNNVRVEYTSGNLIKIDSRYNKHIRMYKTVSSISGNDISDAIDFDGSEITRTEIYNDIKEYIYDNLIKFDLRDNSDRLNSKSYGIYRGLSKFGIGSYGIPSMKVGGFGYADTCVCIENVNNKEFGFRYYGRINVYLLDERKQWLSPVDIDSSISMDGLVWSYPGEPYAYALSDHDTNYFGEVRLNINSNTKIRYLIIAVTEYKGHEFEVRYKHLNNDSSKAFVSNPFGRYPKDAYISDVQINELRAKFETGDRYIDVKNNRNYEVTEGGSVGYIGTINVSGSQGGTIVTSTNDLSNLLVGDVVNILNVDYEITSIDTNNKTIGIEKDLHATISEAPVSLKQPRYTDVNEILSSDELSVKVNNDTKYLMLCRYEEKQSCCMSYCSYATEHGQEQMVFKGSLYLNTKYNAGEWHDHMSPIGELYVNLKDDLRDKLDISLCVGTHNNVRYYALKIHTGEYYSCGFKPTIEKSTISPYYVNGSEFYLERNISTYNKIGGTQWRPTNVYIGFQYFDTTINKPIWWNGESWVEEQDKLISGTNIKTINGNSILGSGNIVISGGGSSSGGGGAYAEVNHGTGDTTFSLTPNTFHVWDEVASLDLSFTEETAGVMNEYLFQFTSGTTATTLTLPDSIKWVNELIISPNTIFQVSVLKGLASVLSWDNSKSVFPTSLVEGDNGEIGVNVYQELNKHIQLKEGDLTLTINGTSYSIISYEKDYDYTNDGFLLLTINDGPKVIYYILEESGNVIDFIS